MFFSFAGVSSLRFVHPDRGERLCSKETEMTEELKQAVQAPPQSAEGASMTKPPAMPELPEPDYWSTRDDDTPLYTADQMRAYALAALQSAQPAEVSDESAYNLIDRFLRNNLHDDDYADYSQALDILALRPQAVPIGRDDLKVLMSAAGYVHATAQEKADFINGFRHAEQHHRIDITQCADGGEAA